MSLLPISKSRFSSPLVGEGCEALANAVSLGAAGWGVPPHEPREQRSNKARTFLLFPNRSCGGTPHPNLPHKGGRGSPSCIRPPPASASTSTGRSVGPSARTATSTPMCASGSITRAGASALLAELEHYGRDTQGRRVSSIFFGGGTPSLMEPETVAALIAARARSVVRRQRRRDHPGSQPDLRRDREVPRLPRRRRQPGVARRAKPGGRRSPLPRPSARRRPGARRGANGGRHLRPLLLRPHLRASQPDPRTVAPGAGPRAGIRRRPHLALSAHHRARHPVRAGGGARRFPRAGRGARCGAL